MSEKLRLLLVEDNPGDVDLIREMLPQGGRVCFAVECVSCIAAALDRLRRGGIELALLDLGLPDSKGIATFRRIHQAAPLMPTVVLTGNDDEETAMAAVKEGAQDYLVKGRVNGHMLVRAARYAVERSRAEAALRKSQWRLKEAQRLGRIGDWEFDLETRKISWSDMVYELYERDRSLGPPTEEEEGRFYTEEQAGQLRQYARRSRETGEPYEIELQPILPSGRRAWFHAIGTAVRDADGRARKLAGTVQDVTGRREAQEAQRTLEDQFRQSQKMEAIGRLAGGIAHDFNNMLGAIIGYADVLLHDLQRENPIYRDIEHIMEVAGRAAQLTRQLLAFSRKQTLRPRVLDLNSVVTQLDRMLRKPIGEDVELVMELAAELGRVKADPGQIEQVIMNLAVNSRDAMPEGGKLILETANVYLDEEYARNEVSTVPGPYVMLAMTDTGCGMDRETKGRVFEPFFTTKETGRGTGLGLSTVYGIVKQSGGSIRIYSQPGRGTTFKIYLPQVEDALEVEEKPAGVAESPRGTEMVLVVEDEEILRRLIARILMLGGYRVIEAANGSEALRQCRNHRGAINLLITDLIMPGMNGRQLAEKLVKIRPELRVLYTSGYTDIAQRGTMDGEIPFIGKPFAAGPLMTKVRIALDRPPFKAGETVAPK